MRPTENISPAPCTAHNYRSVRNAIILNKLLTQQKKKTGKRQNWRAAPRQGEQNKDQPINNSLANSSRLGFGQTLRDVITALWRHWKCNVLVVSDIHSQAVKQQTTWDQTRSPRLVCSMSGIKAAALTRDRTTAAQADVIMRCWLTLPCLLDLSPPASVETTAEQYRLCHVVTVFTSINTH